MNEVLELSSFMKRVSNDSAENKDLQVALWRLLTCYKKTRAGLSMIFQHCDNQQCTARKRINGTVQEILDYFFA